MIADGLYRDGYRLERGGRVEDLPEIELLYRRAAAGGSAEAMGRLGLLLEGRTRAKFEGHAPGHAVGHLGEALEWYRLGAERGDALSAFFLGRLYAEKLGDWEKAVPWYSRASRAGNSDARKRLAAGRHGAIQAHADEVSPPRTGGCVVLAVAGLLPILFAVLALLTKTG